MTGHYSSVACLIGKLESTPYCYYECFPPWDGQTKVVAMKSEVIAAGYLIEEPNPGEFYDYSDATRVIGLLT